MIKILFIIIALVFFVEIIRNTGIIRLSWFLTGIIFFPNSILLMSEPISMPFQRFLIYALFISELVRYESFIQAFKGFPIKKILFLLMISHLIIGLFDERLPLFLKFYRPFYEFVQTFLIVFLGYNSIKSLSDWERIMKLLFISSFVLCLYGLLNFITKANPYSILISNAFGEISFFQSYMNKGDRFRVNSFIYHPITYGYFVSIFLMLFYAFRKNYRNNTFIYTLIMVMLLINLFLTNSRTPLLICVVGLLIYVFFSYNLSSKIKTLLGGGALIVILYLFSSDFQERTDSIADIFITGGKHTTGSSIEMRETQLIESYVLFLQNPYFGNGFSYIIEDLGYSSNEEKRESKRDFYGFESYAYILLIEQGVIQILMVVLFFIFLYIYFVKNKEYTNSYASLGIAYTTMFLVFSFATGTLGTWTISMTLIGSLIKMIEITKLKVQQLYLIKSLQLTTD